MAKARKPHHQVSFASEHRNTIFPTFNAYSALVRAESLLDDVEHLALVYNLAGENAHRGGIVGFDVTDYYAVGYVTCLEWHARSRLADILTNTPSLIQPGMVRSIDAEAISQMLQAGVTLSDLVGASAKINRLGEYVDVFDQVWAALKIPTPLKALLDSSAEIAGGSRALHELFVRRHSLVHEVEFAKIASYVLRDVWSFDEAIAHGKMVVEVIRRIEGTISEFAPRDFPNKLSAEGGPEDRVAILEEKISQLKSRISTAIPSSGVEEFEKAENSATENLKRQVEFVEAALSDVPKRHYNPCPALVEMLRRQEFEFLSAIAKELEA